MTNPNIVTYILLGVYVALMICVTVRANWEKRKTAEIDEAYVSNHFLAAKNFGVVILALTTFASVFSGYTVVGVPNEAGNNGFTAIRWPAGIVAICASLLMIFPRLRRLSITRDYVSPGDFIADRYRNTAVKILSVICLCVPQLLYLAVQLHSLGATLNSLTAGELNFYAVVGVASAMILIFEALGLFMCLINVYSDIWCLMCVSRSYLV